MDKIKYLFSLGTLKFNLLPILIVLISVISVIIITIVYSKKVLKESKK